MLDFVRYQIRNLPQHHVGWCGRDIVRCICVYLMVRCHVCLHCSMFFPCFWNLFCVQVTLNTGTAYSCHGFPPLWQNAALEVGGNITGRCIGRTYAEDEEIFTLLRFGKRLILLSWFTGGCAGRIRSEDKEIFALCCLGGQIFLLV